MLERYLFMN